MLHISTQINQSWGVRGHWRYYLRWALGALRSLGGLGEMGLGWALGV